MSGLNGKDTATLERQQLQALINSVILQPVQVGTQLIFDIFSISSEELSFHRDFETHLRAGTVTEEILQEHLNSLVAFRQRVQLEFAKRSQPTSQTSTTVKDTFT